jgi:mono/diheme cytochrome c family protein
MRRLWTVVVISCAVVWLAASTSVEAQQKGGGAKPAALKNPVPPTPANLKLGQADYGQYCRQCHGLRGKGDGPLAPKNPKPADFSDDKWDHGPTDGDLYTLILNGAPPRPGQKESEMKPMKGTLMPTQIWQVINFIRTFGPKPAPASAPAKK